VRGRRAEQLQQRVVVLVEPDAERVVVRERRPKVVADQPIALGRQCNVAISEQADDSVE
jgi:hypothetical protein